MSVSASSCETFWSNHACSAPSEMAFSVSEVQYVAVTPSTVIAGHCVTHSGRGLVL